MRNILYLMTCSSGEQIQFERLVWSNLQDLRFSWWWSWRLKSSAMWCYIIGHCSLWCLEGMNYLHLQVPVVQEQPFRREKWVPPTTSNYWLATVSSHPVSVYDSQSCFLWFCFSSTAVPWRWRQSCRMSLTTCPLTQCHMPQDLNLKWSNIFFCHTARSSRWGESTVGESDGWTRVWQWWWAAEDVKSQLHVLA
jgi:hypothetical protein